MHKYLNENLKIHLISGFGYKVMDFRDLSRLLAIAAKSSRSNPQHLETHCVPFSHKKINIYSRTQSCNENKLTTICFSLNSPSPTLAKLHDCFVSLSYPYMMHLSMFVWVFTSLYPVLKKDSYEVSGA